MRCSDATLVGKIPAIREKLLEEYPDYCTITDVARMLRISKRAVQLYHSEKIERITVEGMTLYSIKSVRNYAKLRLGRQSASNIAIKGIEVERLRAICEGYYRSHLDSAPPHLLALAKRIAKL